MAHVVASYEPLTPTEKNSVQIASYLGNKADCANMLAHTTHSRSKPVDEFSGLARNATHRPERHTDQTAFTKHVRAFVAESIESGMEENPTQGK